MASSSSVYLALRGSEGISFASSQPKPDSSKDPHGFLHSSSPACRAMCFSEDGSLFAFADGENVKVFDVQENRLLFTIDKPRTSALQFSPKATLLATWEPYSTVSREAQGGSGNMNLWSTATAECAKSCVQKKQFSWCPQWSSNEEISARIVNNEVHFFENNAFDRPAQKLQVQRIGNFAIPSKAPMPCHVAVHAAGAKGQPSNVRLFCYPRFGGPQSAVANKSFYKADKVDLMWNNKGTGILILTGTETSADSYYGDQGLHYVGIDGQSCLVPRDKAGPVYSVEWKPDSSEFCVVYGSMPAKATLYNTKCEPTFDFGTGPRNVSYYNPQGNLLCLAGFGNLQGYMEFWDMKDKKLLAKPQASDATYFEWCPDGVHVVTATTSPRLRVGNGYKLWNFIGTLLYEQKTSQGHDLFEALWQPAPGDRFPPPHIPNLPNQALMKQEVKAAYIPPAMRNRTHAPLSVPKYREAYELSSNLRKQQQEPEVLSKSALKNKKKREAKAQARDRQAEGQQPQAAPTAVPVQCPSNPGPLTGGSENPETVKKIRNLKKKLQQIDMLKEKAASGQNMEKNQLEKLATEESLLQQLRELELE